MAAVSLQVGACLLRWAGYRLGPACCCLPLPAAACRPAPTPAALPSTHPTVLVRRPCGGGAAVCRLQSRAVFHGAVRVGHHGCALLLLREPTLRELKGARCCACLLGSLAVSLLPTHTHPAPPHPTARRLRQREPVGAAGPGRVGERRLPAEHHVERQGGPAAALWRQRGASAVPGKVSGEEGRQSLRAAEGGWPDGGGSRVERAGVARRAAAGRRSAVRPKRCHGQLHSCLCLACPTTLPTTLPPHWHRRGVDVMDLLVTLTTRQGVAQLNSTQARGAAGPGWGWWRGCCWGCAQRRRLLPAAGT